mgnify:FL=1
MEERFLKDKVLIEITEEEEKKDILRNIFHTKAELTNANKNFEFANTNELIDYYVYKIKAMQAQLDSLIKLAKEKGIEVEKLA